MIFFLATAWLLGREYFELAAMRFRPPDEAKALRKRNAATVYVGGLLIAAFVSIPVVNLATPLFAMALMVHVHKRLSERKLIAQPGADDLAANHRVRGVRQRARSNARRQTLSGIAAELNSPRRGCGRRRRQRLQSGQASLLRCPRSILLHRLGLG